MWRSARTESEWWMIGSSWLQEAMSVSGLRSGALWHFTFTFLDGAMRLTEREGGGEATNKQSGVKRLRGQIYIKDNTKIAMQEYLCWEIWSSPKFPFAVSVLDYSFHQSHCYAMQLPSDDPLSYYVSHMCSYNGGIRLTPPTTGEVDCRKKVPRIRICTLRAA